MTSNNFLIGHANLGVMWVKLTTALAYLINMAFEGIEYYSHDHRDSPEQHCLLLNIAVDVSLDRRSFHSVW